MLMILISKDILNAIESQYHLKDFSSRGSGETNLGLMKASSRAAGNKYKPPLRCSGLS
jgi:hypothetical protein